VATQAPADGQRHAARRGASRQSRSQNRSQSRGRGRGRGQARGRGRAARRPATSTATKRAAAEALDGQTRSELLRRAEALDIDGRASMTKAELVRAIKKAPAKGAPSTSR
jgi:hypothetical protein